jgi:hypothetical protein
MPMKAGETIRLNHGVTTVTDHIPIWACALVVALTSFATTAVVLDTEASRRAVSARLELPVIREAPWYRNPPRVNPGHPRGIPV